MADTETTDLTELTSADNGDLLHIVDVSDTTFSAEGTDKKITYTNLLATGWIPSGGTWTYSSVDDPTGVVTVNADLTGVLSAGMRIKMTNGGNTIYGIISKTPTESGGTTTVTFLHEIDPSDSQALHLLADSAITNVYYSTQKAPFGFPLERNKWQVKATDTTLREQATPAQNTWYNLGSFLLSIPIGNWEVSYNACVGGDDASDIEQEMEITLSTANNSASDSDFTGYVKGKSVLKFYGAVTRDKVLTLSSKTPYYLNERTRTSGHDAIYLRNNDQHNAVIKADCSYL